MRLQPLPMIVLVLVVLQIGSMVAMEPAPLVSESLVGVKLSHVMIIVMEDEGIDDICNGSPPPCHGTLAPYLSSLANTYGVASQYVSLYHESLPNYIALLGGDLYGCYNGCPPLNHTTIIDRIEASGLTWKAYIEDYSGGCSGTNLGAYDGDHNPFVHYTDILNSTARCNRIVNPGLGDSSLLADLASNNTASNYMWLTPDLCDDMHDECSGVSRIPFGDNYLAGLVPQILNSTVFRTTDSALFITFDEGNGYCPVNKTSEDCVYTVWAGPNARRSFGSSTLYSHYSLLATLEKVWGLTPLTTNDAAATPMTEFLEGASSPWASFISVLIQVSTFAVPVGIVVFIALMLYARAMRSKTRLDHSKQVFNITTPKPWPRNCRLSG